MRSLRVLTLAMAMALGVAALTGDFRLAFAQSVEDAEDEAADAEREARAASGLVDDAVGRRAEIELQLAETISRISDLSAQLSVVSATLDKLQSQIGYADVELVGITNDLEAQAVDAYMTALAAPGVTLVVTESVERALVAGLVVGDVISSGKAKVDELVVKRRGLEDLQADYLAKQEEVAAIKAQVDAAMANLESLYEEADAAVAAAIREANSTDARYREALTAVEEAQARDAERRRQEQRTTPPTTNPTPPPGSTTTPTSPATPPTTTPAPVTSTTSGGGGGGGSRSFPPAVEQWRSLLQQVFPSHRVEEALAILQCESGGDPNAYNPYSGASGLFQFLPSTWATAAPKAGYPDSSPFDPRANAATAAWLANRYEELGQYYWQAWSCRRVLG